MSEEPEVLLEKNDGVAIITLNRPDRLNALKNTIMAQLRDIVESVAYDNSIGCVVVTGAGRGFCAGGDLKDGGNERAAMTTNRETGTRVEQNFNRLRGFVESARLLHEMPKPTIAMVNGPVAGAGIGIAGSCDLRFGCENSTFLTAFSNIGGGGDFGSTWFLTKILGTGKARELMFLSEKLSAEETHKIGFYNKLIAAENLREETMKIAKKLADGPRMGYRYMKANLNFAEDMIFEAALDNEALNMGLSTIATASIYLAEQKAKKDG